MDKDEFLQQAKKANEEKLRNAKMSDLVNPQSAVYKDQSAPSSKEPLPSKPKFDESGLPPLEGLRTFNADVSEAVEHDNLSLSKIALANQMIKDPSAVPDKPAGLIWGLSQKTIIIGVISLVLVIGGVGLLMGVLFSKKNNAPAPSSPVNTATMPKEIIRIEEQSSILISNKEIADIESFMASEFSKAPQDALIRMIVPLTEYSGTTRKASVWEFMDVLRATIPEELSRTLHPYYMPGIFWNGEPNPFLIMAINSYDLGFKGLLSWEKNMQFDLTPLFRTNKNNIEKFVFKDRVIANQDARVLQNEEGEIFFFYTILNNKIIIFAKNAETLKEIINRIRTEEIEKRG